MQGRAGLEGRRQATREAPREPFNQSLAAMMLL